MKSLSLIKQSDDSSGPPNYRLTNSVAGSNCASCTSFQNPGMCTKYSTAVSPQGICDSYEPFQPDLKAIQNAKPVQAIQANLGPSTDFNSELKFGSDNIMNKQAVDSQLAFKRGFLLRCAEEGLSLEQTHQRIKQAMSMLEKKSFDLSAIAGKATDVAGSLTGGVLGGGALLLPIATGVAGGIAYNKLKPHEDIDTLKREDLRNEYYRLADNMKRKAIIKRLQEQNPGSVIKL